MKENIDSLKGLSVGQKITKEEINTIKSLIIQLEATKDHVATIQVELSEAENKLRRYHQRETDDYNNQIEQREQQELRHFIDINEFYRNDFGEKGLH